MKCAYNQCKLGGNVEKDVATKHSNRYYHKECYAKKIYKEKCRDLLKTKGFVIKTINMTLKKIIDDNNIDPKFLFFTIDYVIKNNLELNNPFGINYYLQNFEINDAYKKIKRLEKIKELKNTDIQLEEIEEPQFKYTKTTPKYLNILKKVKK